PRNRTVLIAFDLNDLFVLDEDLLAAAHSTIRTHRIDHAIGLNCPRLHVVASCGHCRLPTSEPVFAAQLTQNGPRFYERSCTHTNTIDHNVTQRIRIRLWARTPRCTRRVPPVVSRPKRYCGAVKSPGYKPRSLRPG